MTVAEHTLRVARGACPVCEATAGEVVLRAPAQLAAVPHEFAFVRCDGCGLTYLRDRLSDADLAALEGPGGYVLHRGPRAWGPFARFVRGDLARTDEARVARLTGARKITHDDTVLDLGCGAPTFLAALRRATGCRAVGLDITPAGETHADAGVELITAAPEAWEARVAELPKLAAATFWHSLEHDPRPVDTLRWVRERLAPGGVVVIEVPDLTGETARWMGAWWPGYHTPRHVSVFNPATLRATVERAGLHVVSHDRRGSLPPYTLLALGALDRVGFRFGPRATPAVFPLWAAGYALGWPTHGRREREGMGFQTLVARAG